MASVLIHLSVPGRDLQRDIAREALFIWAGLYSYAGNKRCKGSMPFKRAKVAFILHQFIQVF